MNHDAVFRSSLCWLAAMVVLVGVFTFSIKKMMATYFWGMFVICGVLLPDWEFFDRSVTRWFSPVTVEEFPSRAASARNETAPMMRYRIYGIRLVLYTAVYGFVLYKWWSIISN